MKTIESLTAAIDAALANKQVWNAEYTEMKYWFAKQLGDAEKQAQNVYLSLPRLSDYGGRVGGKTLEDLYYANIQSNTFPKLKRTIDAAARVAVAENELAVVAAYIILYETFDPLAAKLNQLKQYIVKGRKPSDAPRLTDPRTIDNTGTCPVCGRNIKLEGGAMVAHGYQMSGYNHSGFRSGNCFGVGYPPIEVSDKGVRAFRAMAISQLERTENALAKLPNMTELYLPSHRVTKTRNKTTRGDSDFDQVVKAESQRMKSEISALKSEIRHCDEVIENWYPKALPDGNEDHLK